MTQDYPSSSYWIEDSLGMIFFTIATVVFILVIIIVFTPLGPLLTIHDTFSKNKWAPEHNYFLSNAHLTDRQSAKN